ncbi:UNVERIFIED_CONTAM: hypothetical protein Slati_1322000 [Sesamum latifolium]|uniref:Uncharacterized protein n=1 Tax=Sesamum latifolium TaxID=2727402 RepID=A0AAW2XHA0_9LAMI
MKFLLSSNPTMAQIKYQKEKKTKKSKAKPYLFVVVSSTIFTRIMTMKSTYEMQNYLKSEYERDDRIKGMLLDIANQIRLLGSTFNDSRIVEKILVTVPEKFETSISALENTKDLTLITLTEIQYFAGTGSKKSHEARKCF